MRKKKEKTMYQRFFKVIVGLVAVALMVMGIAIYVVVYRITREDAEKGKEATLAVSEEVLKDKLDTFRGIGRMVLSNPNVQRELKKLGENEKDEYFIPIRSTTLFYEALSEYTSDINHIESIYLYDRHGRLFYLDDSRKGVNLQEQVIYEEIIRSAWYDQAQKAEGQEVFYSENVLYPQERETISCVKILKNLEDFENIGLLILNIRKEAFSSIFPEPEGESDCYLITDEQTGKIVYQSTKGNALPEEDYFRVSAVDKKTNWTLSYLIKKSEMISRIKLIGILTAAVMLATVLGAAVAARFLARAITRPLNQLNVLIQKVGKGERNLEEHFGEDEIGKIGKEFCQMVKYKLEMDEKLTQFQLKQKDAEFQLLQEQINPHFLYNALDSIYWTAILEKQDKIADITKALSDMFKLSLNRGEQITTVQKELDMLKDYLLVQNYRYDGKFSYEMEVENELLGYPIVKLILQPFVENAVVHGIEPKCGDGHIWIKGYVQEKDIVFTVEDDGVGTEKQEDEWNGYGIRNVMNRIKLYYGEGYGVVLKSERGKGTKVVIRIPYEEGKQYVKGGFD